MKNGTEVKINNLTFGYHKDHDVLKGLSLHIKAGERLGIIGPTGAGKSTLLLHLNGILTGKSGNILIDNIEVNRKTLPIIREKVGLVFQNPDDQLFNPTVEEDIAFGPLNFGFSRVEAEKRVKLALDAFNLKGFEKLSPHHLSYGERKRVALATVLALEPGVIAFDEPFANLDPGMVNQIIEIIKSLDVTVIIVSQSILPAFACCDRIAVIIHGELKRVGTPAEIAMDKDLLKNNGLDFSLYCNLCKEIWKG
jgi:cobalt/nickel transport system ATP-binding protein